MVGELGLARAGPLVATGSRAQAVGHGQELWWPTGKEGRAPRHQAGPGRGSPRLSGGGSEGFYLFIFKWKLDFIPAEGNWSCGDGLKANESELCRLQSQLSVLILACILKRRSSLNVALTLFLRAARLSGDTQSKGRLLSSLNLSLRPHLIAAGMPRSCGLACVVRLVPLGSLPPPAQVATSDSCPVTFQQPSSFPVWEEASLIPRVSHCSARRSRGDFAGDDCPSLKTVVVLLGSQELTGWGLSWQNGGEARF